MSTSRSNTAPVGFILACVVGVALVAGVMADKLLGYLARSGTVTPDAPGTEYWPLLLGVVVPFVVVAAVAVFLWVEYGR